MSSTPSQSENDDAGPVRFGPLEEFPGSLASKVYHSLKHAILSMAIRPGEILRKGDICSQLNVSRSPVSEAMTRLAGEGLVDVVPQAGTFVSHFSMKEIREGAFLREALELQAIEQVAETITEDQLKQLRRNLRVQEALVADGDFTGFYELDSEMHDLIMSFTGFHRVAQIAETSWLQVNRARQLVLPDHGRVEETLAEHRRILDALEARDPEAARAATRAHLRQLICRLEPLERKHPELFQSK
ncbi:GntR family transcriptional regulator [Sulfitobacter sp. D35]|uniref:GntR family transcriptional regulator n=1 Tax=Sulfitobacter sp. D35 TaxID=3083252 RepID=UPI00296FC6DA|nr:GntR family transcriptional regulator [Sulfitobacter sp. D35]MDW4500024.1 GntR family transcriptional regulator [Sulfitobacter sp. D35]